MLGGGLLINEHEPLRIKGSFYSSTSPAPERSYLTMDYQWYDAAVLHEGKITAYYGGTGGPTIVYRALQFTTTGSAEFSVGCVTNSSRSYTPV